MFLADVSIVIRTDLGVDVFPDNTSHISMSPPTTPETNHQRDTNRRAALSATTSTPATTTHTLE
jgi:hypothetical protein